MGFLIFITHKVNEVRNPIRHGYLLVTYFECVDIDFVVSHNTYSQEKCMMGRERWSGE